MNVICGECMCLVPVGRWIGHLTYHEGLLLGLLVGQGVNRKSAAVRAANLVRHIQVVPA